MEKIAISIAVFSLFISAVMAGWTIYRDAIQKPKFRVSIGLKTIYRAGRKTDGPHVFLEALNLGPIPNRIGMPNARLSWWERWIKRSDKAKYAFIYPDYQHTATTKAAERIEIGDIATFVFPFDSDCFLKENFSKIGVTDGYGRLHWAPRKQLRKAQAKYREEDFAAG